MNLVAVLRTAEPGLLPLAKMTLEQAGIPYVVSERGGTIMQLGYAPESPANAPPVAFEILVNAEDAAKARELVADLEAGVSAPAETSAPPEPAKTDFASPVGPAVALTDLDGNRPIARITDAQLETMLTHLEKESADDREFYLTKETIDMLAEAGLDAEVVTVLRAALGRRDGMDIRWDV